MLTEKLLWKEGFELNRFQPKKVLLVRPMFEHKDLKPYPPTSLVVLAPHFKYAEVFICDLQAGENFRDALRIKPDLILFSGFTSQLNEINNLAKFAKDATPNVKTVAGGSGITSSPEYAQSILKDVELLISGDGEEFAQNYLDLMNYKGIFSTKRFDWKGYKIPDWNLIQNRRYIKNYCLAVETSRGCPYNCIFCTAHCVHGKQWRPRDPENIVSEIKYLRYRYGCKLFYFPDDNATVDPKRWINLMQKIVEAKLDTKFHAPEGIQAHHLDFETLKLMKDAGFNNIYIGAESGVQRVLDDVIDKGGLTVEKIEEVVKASVKIGLTINCFFVIGIVGETLEEVRQTVVFAEKMRKFGAYDCIVRDAIPIKGTRMYDVAKEKGFLAGETKDFSSNQTRHLLNTSEWNSSQIEEFVKLSHRQQAQHILRHKRGYMIRKGIPKLFNNPKGAVKRLIQLSKEGLK